MVLTNDIYNVLRFLLQDDGDAQIVTVKNGNDYAVHEINSTLPTPTDQEIIDADADLTSVNGQLFSEWYAEHGGDVIATLRRNAKEALDAQQQEINALIRALALVVMDEINILRADNNIGLPARTASQLRTAIKAKIDAGDADT